jgi:dTMP kinase
VISDRFYDSTTVYQGYGRKIPLDLVRKANSLAVGETIPDRTYIFKIPWEESLRRRSLSSKKADRMEKDVAEFYELVHGGYMALADEEPDRIRLLDGTRSVESLELEIRKDVLHIIGQSADKQK